MAAKIASAFCPQQYYTLCNKFADFSATCRGGVPALDIARERGNRDTGPITGIRDTRPRPRDMLSDHRAAQHSAAGERKHAFAR